MIFDSANIKVSKIIGKLLLFCIIFFIQFIIILFIIIILLEEYQDVSVLFFTYITDIKIFLIIILLLALFLTLIIYKFPYSFTKRYTLKTLEFFNRIDPEDGFKLTILGAFFSILFSVMILIFSSIFSIDNWYSSLFINFSGIFLFGIFLFLSFYYYYTSTGKLINLEKALRNLDEIDDNYKSNNEISKFSRNFKIGLKEIELKLQKDCSLNNIKFNMNNYKINDFVQQINSYLFYGGKEEKEEIKLFINNIKNNVEGHKVNGKLLLKNMLEMDNKITTFFNKNSMNLTKPFSFGSSLMDFIKNRDIQTIIALIFAYIIYFYLKTTIDIQFP